MSLKQSSLEIAA